MADYIYLLESRLSKAQHNAINLVRDIARERGLTIFLVGGAVRDLTSGSPVRDLDVVVQGNALKLKKDIERVGGTISGESEAGQALYIRFPGSVRLELGSTLSVTYPKPGKPVAKTAGILEDLRRRDFTANAMALSLNAGSYGLLMDPLNGVADIENRELRLVSNYGFIEDPIRMVRATRLMARLGWGMDEKTQARYETGKQEGYISAASASSRGYEAEEIVHEEDPLRVMKRLEAEGWLKELAPAWASAKASEGELQRLRESQTQLQMQGIHPSPAAANFPLLTAKMSPQEIADLKASFPRTGFVHEIEALDAEAKELGALLTAKGASLPSQAWKILHAAKPEAVLQVAFSSKSPAIQGKLKNFFTEWPQARQKVPYALMQEMRIVPDLPGYDAFVESLIFELMDGKLTTTEELRAFLEPFSPPAPPPPVHLRRPRAAKKDAKSSKGRAKKAASVVADDVESGDEPEAVSDETSSATDLDDDDDDDSEIPVKKAGPDKSGVVPAKTSKETSGKETSAKTAPAKTATSAAVSASTPILTKKTAPTQETKKPKAAAPATVKAPAKVASTPGKASTKPAFSTKAPAKTPEKKSEAKSPAKTAAKKTASKPTPAATKAPTKQPVKVAAKKTVPPAKAAAGKRR